MTRIAVISALLTSIFAATTGICLADFSAVQTQPQTIYHTSNPLGGSKWTIQGDGSAAWIDDSWLAVNCIAGSPGERLALEITFSGQPPTSIPFVPYVIGGTVVDPVVTGQTARWEWDLAALTGWPAADTGDDLSAFSLPVASFNLDIGFIDDAFTTTYPVATFNYDGTGIGITEIRLEAGSGGGGDGGGPSVIPAPGSLLLCGIGLTFAFATCRLRRP